MESGFLWCCRGGLNSRPLPYQGSALPLSYGSRSRGAAFARPAALRRAETATRDGRVQGSRAAMVGKAPPAKIPYFPVPTGKFPCSRRADFAVFAKRNRCSAAQGIWRQRAEIARRMGGCQRGRTDFARIAGLIACFPHASWPGAVLRLLLAPAPRARLSTRHV
jgi:hypothetical protein